MAPVLLDHKLDVIEFVEGLVAGDPMLWGALGAILLCVAFFATYQRVTGKSYVKDARTRRRAKARRYHVLWEHERDG